MIEREDGLILIPAVLSAVSSTSRAASPEDCTSNLTFCSPEQPGWCTPLDCGQCSQTDPEPDPPTPPTPTLERSTISHDNLTSTSVRLIVTRNDATELWVFFREGRANGTGTTIYNSHDDPSFSPGSTWRKTFTGLTPAAWYTYNLWDDLEGWIGGEEFETPPQLLDPWEWWSDVSRDATIAISADEWNAFCDFINEVRVQRGLSRYTAGNFGSMTSDEILSAEGYDHAVYAIGAMIPGFTQEYGRLSEDQIEASLFNGLKDGINSLLV